MAIDKRPSKDYLVLESKRTEEFIRSNEERQDWIFCLLFGSFIPLLLLNYFFPDVYWVEPRRALEIRSGFLGVILMFFGTVFFTRAFFVGGDDRYWALSVILSLILLYFGIPLLFG